MRKFYLVLKLYGFQIDINNDTLGTYEQRMVL